MDRSNQDLDQYLAILNPNESEVFALAKSKSKELGKDQISISRSDAAVLGFILRLCKCAKFVEVGTLTGYSALAILEALPEGTGELWTCERDPKHISAAKEVFAKIPNMHGKKLHLLEGDAEENLRLIERHGPFDGMFIDANKAATGFYIEWALRNLKQGGLIVCDNTLFHGRVLEHAENESSHSRKNSDKLAKEIDQANRKLLDPCHFLSVLMPTSDGMIFAIKL